VELFPRKLSRRTGHRRTRAPRTPGPSRKRCSAGWGPRCRNAAPPPSGPPSPQLMAEMGRLIESMSKAGVLVATGGIESRSTGLHIARREDRYTVEVMEPAPARGGTTRPVPRLWADARRSAARLRADRRLV
jgi:hypothetical protein